MASPRQRWPGIRSQICTRTHRTRCQSQGEEGRQASAPGRRVHSHVGSRTEAAAESGRAGGSRKWHEPREKLGGPGAWDPLCIARGNCRGLREEGHRDPRSPHPASKYNSAEIQHPALGHRPPTAECYGHLSVSVKPTADLPLRPAPPTTFPAQKLAKGLSGSSGQTLGMVPSRPHPACQQSLLTPW